MRINAYLLLIPLAVSLLAGESEAMSFLPPIIFLLAFSSLAAKKMPSKTNIFAGEGVLIVALAWILFSFFGAVPFYLSGTLPTFIDALFESVAGFSTTGATIILQIICLILAGMPIFDSIITSFATAGTGGFSSKNASIAYYNSPAIELIIASFMLLFGINFNIYYFMLSKNIFAILHSEEMRWYLLIVFFATLLMTGNLFLENRELFTAFRHSFFQVTSIITTTGFSTMNFTDCPNLSQAIMILLVSTGLDLDDSVAASIGTLNNVSAGLKISGSVESLMPLTPFAKLILCFNMLAGRLEYFPVLALLAPSTWKK